MTIRTALQTLNGLDVNNSMVTVRATARSENPGCPRESQMDPEVHLCGMLLTGQQQIGGQSLRVAFTFLSRFNSSQDDQLQAMA